MKILLKKSLLVLKKKWWKFLLIDITFLILASLLILYSRLQLKNYFIEIQALQSQIANVEALLVQNATLAQTEFTILLEQLYPITAKVQLFFFILIPVGIFLIWCFSQSFNFNLIRMNKIYNSEYLYKFFTISFPIFLILFLLIKVIVDLVSTALFEGVTNFLPKICLILILIVFVLYILFISYAFLNKLSLPNYSKLVFSSFKKFFKLFPLFLFFLFLSFIFLFFYFSVLVSIVGQSWKGVLLFTVLAFLMLSLLTWFRTFYVFYVQKQEII